MVDRSLDPQIQWRGPSKMIHGLWRGLCWAETSFHDPMVQINSERDRMAAVRPNQRRKGRG